ncbi:MAG: class I SAM-dependent methyltransferase [Bacteroidia bacterium]|nr:class I SAM-dependent methyltransferase [Bacteroidia bacterium]
METLHQCPICEKPGFRAVQACVDYTVSRETFTISECESCGFWFTNPRPGPGEIGRYYESEEYISHSGKSRGLMGALYRRVRDYTLRRKLALVVGQHPGKREIRLLDIGCGTGEFLNVCSLAGLVVSGIEPSLKARTFAQTNYSLVVGEESQINALEKASFDVITMWHVLEHVHSLKERARQIYSLLSAGGVAVIAVPNRSSWDAEKYKSEWAAYDLPRHLYHFRREDIQRLFEAEGFRLTGTLPMKFDSYYVSMLSDRNTGRGSLLGSTWNGLVSNLKASTRDGTWSSQIYILKK